MSKRRAPVVVSETHILAVAKDRKEQEFLSGWKGKSMMPLIIQVASLPESYRTLVARLARDSKRQAKGTYIARNVLLANDPNMSKLQTNSYFLGNSNWKDIFDAFTNTRKLSSYLEDMLKRGLMANNIAEWLTNPKKYDFPGIDDGSEVVIELLKLYALWYERQLATNDDRYVSRKRIMKVKTRGGGEREMEKTRSLRAVLKNIAELNDGRLPQLSPLMAQLYVVGGNVTGSRAPNVAGQPKPPWINPVPITQENKPGDTVERLPQFANMF